MHGGHIIGDLLTNQGLSGAKAGGGSGQGFFIATIAALAVYLVALFLTHRHVRGKA